MCDHILIILFQNFLRLFVRNAERNDGTIYEIYEELLRLRTEKRPGVDEAVVGNEMLVRLNGVIPEAKVRRDVKGSVAAVAIEIVAVGMIGKVVEVIEKTETEVEVARKTNGDQNQGHVLEIGSHDTSKSGINTLGLVKFNFFFI